MTITGQNKQIGCIPGEVTGATAKVEKGFARIEQKTGLLPLKVVYGTDDGVYRSGDTVYVRADQQRGEWFSAKYEIDGREIVLCPTDLIRLRLRPE